MEKSSRISQAVIPLVIALGTIILLFALFSSWGVTDQAKHAVIKNGELDLSDWYFDDKGNVKLDGNWEFYWDQIITPEEFAAGSPKLTGNYPVPLYWTKYDGLNLPSKGDATYRLVIKTNGEDEYLAISTPELYTEYALYINGRLLVGNGKLGGTSFRFLDPDAYMFDPGGDRIEIVLQMHNQSHVNAGIGQSFVLGTTDSIFWKQNVESAIDLILAGICLFAGIYHFVLFLYRRKDYKLLCFTIFCVAVAVRGLIANTTFVMKLFPDLPFVVGSRIVTETIPVLTVSMLLYVYFMFRERIPKWLIQTLVAVSIIYILIVILTDPYIYSSLFFGYLIITMAVCVIGLYVAVRVFRERSSEAVLFLAGILFIIAGAVNDTLVFLQLIDTGYRLGVGLAGFAIIQSFIMAMQYTRFIDERQQLYEKLHETDLAFMQAQIKPHFLYNALSAISHMIGTDPKKAKELLLDFSDYLRGCFDFSNTSGMNTLSKEMDIVKAYLSIEKARFQDRLNVEYEIEENPHVLIPMLCIQPIVENAVRHGIMPRAEGGIIKIKVWNEKGDTHIRVADDGVGIPEVRMQDIFREDTTSTGLTNINGRLKLKFGTKMKITSRANEGTIVEIIIPKRPKLVSELQE
jgi:sensor histidine kinase YesM